MEGFFSSSFFSREGKGEGRNIVVELRDEEESGTLEENRSFYKRKLDDEGRWEEGRGRGED